MKNTILFTEKQRLEAKAIATLLDLGSNKPIHAFNMFNIYYSEPVKRAIIEIKINSN